MGNIIFKKPSIQKAIRSTIDTFNREKSLSNKAVDVVENKKRKRKKDAEIDKATVQN